MKRMRAKFGVALVAVWAAGAAWAGPEGTWASPPDRKGQIGHVQVTKCGNALCGKIIRAYDKTGARITTKNVGKRVLWGMTATGGDSYDGRVFVPLVGQDFPGKLTMRGANQMVVRGCSALGCRSQTWTRVK